MDISAVSKLVWQTFINGIKICTAAPGGVSSGQLQHTWPWQVEPCRLPSLRLRSMDNSQRPHWVEDAMVLHWISADWERLSIFSSFMLLIGCHEEHSVFKWILLEHFS